ncbi:MAG: hypothetical protein DMG97_07880 [Acidobacteria bacterium]|nr:MAG: hypothetical protein DMG97_07880 [Acidobacteriota bacterium]
MIGKDLGDGARGIGRRLRKKTAGRREWDSRYTKQCNTKVLDCQVICCISFEWRGKLKKMRLLMAWKWRAKLQEVGRLKRQNPARFKTEARGTRLLAYCGHGGGTSQYEPMEQ